MPEVLITLGIIGMVAAIVLPALITNIQDKQHAAMWKKKYSEIANIYNLVKNEIGGEICTQGGTGSTYSTLTRCRKFGDKRSDYTTLSPEFVDKFVSHLKVVDSCGRTAYGETKKCDNYHVRWQGVCGAITYYGSLAVNHGSTTHVNAAACSPSFGLTASGDLSNKAVLLADGSVIYFGGYATGLISVDVNGFQNGPNVVGRDLFVVMVNDDWIKPIGAEDTFSTSANGKTCECSKDYGAERAQGFLGSTDLFGGKMLSGVCCSATKLLRI